MSQIKQLIAEECTQSPEFSAAYEEESARLALFRARNNGAQSQNDVS